MALEKAVLGVGVFSVSEVPDYCSKLRSLRVTNRHRYVCQQTLVSLGGLGLSFRERLDSSTINPRIVRSCCVGSYGSCPNYKG